MQTVLSKNNIPIRLTHERWYHIIENHDNLAGKQSDILDTIAEPDIIAKGVKQEFLATKKLNKQWIVVVCKEVNKKDGFIITAFTTTRLTYILKKNIVWKKQS